jgi:hypothetical protein
MTKKPRRDYPPEILKIAEEWVNEHRATELEAIPELQREIRRQAMIKERAESLMTQYDLDRRF